MIEIKGLTFEVAEKRLRGLTGTLAECQLPQCNERGILPSDHCFFDAGSDSIASFSDDLESKSFEIDPFLRFCTEVGSGNGRMDPSPRLISARLLVGQISKIGGMLNDRPGFQVASEIFSVQFLFRKFDEKPQVKKFCKFFGSIEAEDDSQIPLHILPEIAHEWFHQVAQIGSTSFQAKDHRGYW